MLSLLRRLLQNAPRTPSLPLTRPRLSAQELPAALYAIGDVHGCLDELLLLEAALVEDSAQIAGEKWIVMLGDYIDRGRASAAVIHHLRQPAPVGYRRFCLAGNHEEMLLDFLEQPSNGEGWVEFGGLETARSYGISEALLEPRGADPRRIAGALQFAIPPGDIGWMRELPVALSLPGWLFVHAGMVHGVRFEDQADHDLLSVRLPLDDERELVPGTVVVHGHTPTAQPVSHPGRICIDTGCYATGTLTALRVVPGQTPWFLHVSADGNTGRTNDSP